MELVPKRDRKRLSFFGIAGSILVLQSVTDVNELPQKDNDHDKSQNKADDRGIKRGAAIVQRVLHHGWILGRKDTGKENVDAEKADPCQDGTKRAVCAITYRRGDQGDDQERKEFQPVHGKKGADDGRKRDADPPLIRKYRVDKATEEQLLDQNRKEKAD